MDINMRRRSKRVTSEIAVEWTRGGKQLRAVAGDINEHGLFVKTALAPLRAQEGELLELTIKLPERAVRACVVVRFLGDSESGTGVGAEIFAIADTDRKLWSNYYRSQLFQGIAAVP